VDQRLRELLVMFPVPYPKNVDLVFLCIFSPKYFTHNLGVCLHLCIYHKFMVRTLFTLILRARGGSVCVHMENIKCKY
jgi:hypothetical protein